MVTQSIVPVPVIPVGGNDSAVHTFCFACGLFHAVWRSGEESWWYDDAADASLWAESERWYLQWLADNHQVDLQQWDGAGL
jgi:hypothetical protein